MEGRIRFAGMICLIGGILWVITLALLAGVTVGSPAYFIVEIVLVAAQVMLLIGMLGLTWSGAAGNGWFAKVALSIALLGRVTFVVAELQALVSGNDDSPLLPVAAVLTAFGMLLVSIAVLRTAHWNGWTWIAPLLCGLYPFLAMFPFIIISDEPNPWAIAGWGLCWALLGLAMRANTTRVEQFRSSPVR